MKNLSWCLTALIVCILVSSPLVVFAGLEEQLEKDLTSLRIAKLDSEKKTVFYFPAHIVFGTMGAETSGKPVILDIGTQLMINGLVSLAAVEKDVEELKARAAKELGAEAQIELAKPESYSLVVMIDGKSALNRPFAGGSLKNLPFQVMVAKPDKDIKKLPVIANMKFAWKHTLPASGVNLSFNWKAIAEAVVNEIKISGSLPTSSLQGLSQRLVTEGSVKITHTEGAKESQALQEQAMKAVIDQIVKNLLVAPPSPAVAASSTLSAPGFSFNEAQKIETLQTDLNLNSTSIQDATLEVNESINLSLEK